MATLEFDNNPFLKRRREFSALGEDIPVPIAGPTVPQQADTLDRLEDRQQSISERLRLVDQSSIKNRLSPEQLTENVPTEGTASSDTIIPEIASVPNLIDQTSVEKITQPQQAGSIATPQTQQEEQPNEFETFGDSLTNNLTSTALSSGVSALLSGGSTASGVASIPTATGQAGVLLADGTVAAASSAQGASALGTAGAGGAFATIAPIAAAPLAVGTVVNTITGIQGLLDGRDLTLEEEVALAFQTFGFSAIREPVEEIFGFGSGRNDRDRQADSIRDILQEGLGETQSFQGVNGEIALQFRDIDANNPLSGDAVALLDPIAEAIAGGDDEKREDIAALLANPIIAGSNNRDEIVENIVRAVDGLGLTLREVHTRLSTLINEDKIDPSRVTQYNILLNELIAKDNELRGI